ncbi:oligoendopeptidase F [Catellicoccus marimammalium]|uniref:Oligopeptidase F n=1 Tax=Catellicoccus marimammalium M35/04/3 TaxID=1234409 RepID=K8ZD22_9ENTE|nr:oligoendopeptidase F [Catellicoccus marimammalium]EKU27957.1 Oligoendopeptidase F [Catellicoccus marimammalium M35/04/3]
MAKKLPKRSEIEEKWTWDLSRIFKNEEELEEAFSQLDEKIAEVSQGKGTLGDGVLAVKKATDQLLSLYRSLEVIYVYASMKNDEDTANAKYQALMNRVSGKYTEAVAAASYYTPELLSLSDEVLEEYLQAKELQEYHHFLEQTVRSKPHVLSEKEEALLAQASEIFSASSDTFEVMNNADFDFGMIQNAEGEEVQLSHGSYGQLLESTDRNVRKEAFQQLYRVYDQFQHTTASTLSHHVKGHNFSAKVRNYSSARAASLDSNDIPESVYDTLIEVVHEHLPLLHRYVALRKKLLQVDELHMYDMYTPLMGEAPLRFSYEEACKVALEALQPLGKDYVSVVEKAFQSRWIDVKENAGKRSGAYSSGCYDTDPYILLNWHDSLDQLFTLVHEMGHSMHSYLTRSHQPYVYGDYSIFLAEIASTTNENLLTEYLLQTQKDPKVRAYVLNHYLDGFKGTVFRQTQFAEFEQWIHVTDAKGEPLTSQAMNEYYGDLNQEYYGPAVEKDPEIALEWSRIPHFYYNFYVYQYATGFAAASALAKNITEGKEGALEHYLNFLKAGSSDYPIAVMKKAGVDMTQKDYLESAFAVFEERLNELEQLVEEL